jgi:N-hydroxyarylamine O-acetyltransferase
MDQEAEGDLIDKIVRRRRAASAMSSTAPFALLLEALGAQVTRVAARVYGPDGLGPPFDHLALIVRPADGSGPWLADVGFGSPQYRLETRERSLADCVPTCWWQQTSPLSHFTQSTICSRLTPGGRISISGRLLIQTQDGNRTEHRLETDDLLLAAYRDHFGVVLSRVPDDPTIQA